MKEITAEILACSEGFSTHEQSTIRLNGGQWDANVEQLQRENEKLGGNARVRTKVEAAQEAHSSRKKAKNRQRETITHTTPKTLADGALRLCVALL